MQRRAEIDGLHAWAVTMVVGAHAYVPGMVGVLRRPQAKRGRTGLVTDHATTHLSFRAFDPES